jgi:hypothetical protein
MKGRTTVILMRTRENSNLLLAMGRRISEYFGTTAGWFLGGQKKLI